MALKSAALSAEELVRYNRQIIFSGWGEEAQKRLKESTIFIAGAGGLGSPVSVYLAAAGVGCLRIADSETVELSNLNRQFLHSDGDVGSKKVESARREIARLNPHVEAVILDETITPGNISSLASSADVLIDCLDNFETRYVLNEFAVKKRLPFIHAGIYGMCGQVTFIHSPETPCLKCIFPEAPLRETFPVVGPAPGVVGSIEALEALKYLTGIGTPLKSRLLLWEGDLGRFEEIRVEKDPSCPVCGAGTVK